MSPKEHPPSSSGPSELPMLHHLETINVLTNSVPVCRVDVKIFHRINQNFIKIMEKVKTVYILLRPKIS